MPVRSFTDAEILVSERRRLERPLVVLVWLGIALFSLAEKTSTGTYFLIAGTVAAGIKLQAVSRGKELFLRRFLVNAGVLVATAGVILGLTLQRGDPARDTEVVLGHYAILIQLCKLFERAKNRDYVQVLVLSLLTVMTSCIFSDELWLAVAVCAYLALACHTTMVLTLKRGLDAAAEACLATESGPLPAHKVAWNVRRDWPARALRWKLVPVLVVMAAMGALFFLVAPRARPLGRPGPRSEKSSGVTGFADTVQLGDAKTVYLSDHFAMEVLLTTAPGRRASLGGPLYLRGHVLEVYRESRWERPPGGYREMVVPESLAPGSPPPPPGRFRQEISMARSLWPTLFGVAPVTAVWADRNTGAIEKSATGDMQFRRIHAPSEESDDFRLKYVVESEISPRLDPLGQEGDASLPEFAPGYTPLVRDLAQTWCRDLLNWRQADPNRREATDRAIAQRIAERLRESYKYSLDLSSCSPARDGVEDFLFHMKQGHCEYFASAMTLMCRSVGLRARLATGFRVDDLGGPDTLVTVRDRDAHAWTEVYEPARGWVVYDATPSGYPQPVERHWWGFFWESWEDADQLWYQKVIRYSAQDQADLVRKAREWAQDAYAALQRGLNALISSEAVDWAFLEVVIAMGAVAALAEVLILAHLFWRKTQAARLLRRAAGDQWRQMRFLGRFLRLLARNGVRARPEMTLLETASAAADRLALPADQVRGLIRLYYRLRWGRQDISPAEVATAEETVENWTATLSRRKRLKPDTGTGE